MNFLILIVIKFCCLGKMRRRSARLLARASESEDDGAECVKLEIKQTPSKEDNLGRERPKSKSKKDTSTPSSTTKKTGRGMGLHSVKIYVEQLNGQIEVSSKVGQGTTFTVKLPPSWETGYF